VYRGFIDGSLGGHGVDECNPREALITCAFAVLAQLWVSALSFSKVNSTSPPTHSLSYGCSDLPQTTKLCPTTLLHNSC
jgi:hypothetical protein